MKRFLLWLFSPFLQVICNLCDFMLEFGNDHESSRMEYGEDELPPIDLEPDQYAVQMVVRTSTNHNCPTFAYGLTRKSLLPLASEENPWVTLNDGPEDTRECAGNRNSSRYKQYLDPVNLILYKFIEKTPTVVSVVAQDLKTSGLMLGMVLCDCHNPSHYGEDAPTITYKGMHFRFFKSDTSRQNRDGTFAHWIRRIDSPE